VIAIGGLHWDPVFPDATHRAFGAPGASLAGSCLPPTPTLRCAIGDLPAPSVEDSNAPLPDHVVRPLSNDDLERAKLLAEGECMRDLPEELWHNSYRRRAYRRVMDGTPTERRGGAPAGLRRLRGDEPCKAITSGARTEFLHPREDRSLTLRECARIQTFPDRFVFSGSTSERALLIGNAVPPRLAEILGRSIQDIFFRNNVGRTEGALLSFVPTLSEGMSPALRRTTNLIRKRFSCSNEDTQALLWP
jgi:DNA (cytosine-5)-methyltransferase 1